MAQGLNALSIWMSACAVVACTSGAHASSSGASQVGTMGGSRGGRIRQDRGAGGQPGGVVVVEAAVPGAQLGLGSGAELGHGLAVQAPPGACEGLTADRHRDGAGVVAVILSAVLGVGAGDVLGRAEVRDAGPAVAGAVTGAGHGAG